MRYSLVRLPFAARYAPLVICVVLAVLALASLVYFSRGELMSLVALIVFGGLSLVGLHDLAQTRHAILRNYPITAHLRFMFEEFRPELRQYFFESEKDGQPFSRDERALVYQRAKGTLDKRPFGTQRDVYDESYEWLSHSMMPLERSQKQFRITVGGAECKHPYQSSILNISGMSFGAISPNAIRALNRGARLGRFAHNTGEGSISPYHEEHGGDLVWQIGSGYFGCRTANGSFDPERFARTASSSQVKMIEVKLSQGAKPGHGGVLPAAKITAEIAATRAIPMGVDCVSPASHSEFSTPLELLEFVARLRELSGGKPTGIKLCLGHPWEFLSLCRAMHESGMTPDFITIDGKEGGTGAAPLEYADHVGMPLRDGLSFAHNALVGINMRERVRLAASGKILSAFDIARAVALGADWCNSARPFMFAVGCIQAQSCHTGCCPVGVTTQDPLRQRALVVSDKSERVYKYHRATVDALAELVGSAGLSHTSQLRPQHLYRRVSQREYVTFAQLYPSLEPGELLKGTSDVRFREAWELADASSFEKRLT